MRYGIFSDVHSNLEAFEVVVDSYKKERIDKFIFLGDIIGYGANPSQVISLLKTLNPVVVAGNHDWAVIDKFSIKYFNIYAREAIIWTKNNLKKEDFSYLHTFKIIHKENNFICVHASPKQPHEFNYIWNVADAWENFFLFKEKICFIGHSHKKEGFFLEEKGEIFYLQKDQIRLNYHGKYIINVGSVGQPRDGDNRACFCIYDSDENLVIFRRIEYNIKKAADKILKQGLPSLLAFRLYQGQ
jgi:predicted phosphodiesterase